MKNRRLVLVVTSLLFTNLATHAQTYIFGRTDLAVGVSTFSLATGDFNGDGILDLVAVNLGDNTVSILLGKADGGFSPQVTYPTGPAPTFAVVADFNGDGNVDLAVTNGNCFPNHDLSDVNCDTGTVSILLGNGDGSFQPQVEYAAGTAPSAIAASDFNGDGKLDLAIANQADSTLSILLGNGDGTFQPQVVYATATQVGPSPFFESNNSGLLIGDFNGDHKPDLAVAGWNTVSVLLGNGDGTFQKHADSGVGGTALAAADFNRDGNLDLVVTGGNATSVLLGKGDGTFAIGATYSGGATVATADLNGDGKPDLVISGNFAPLDELPVFVLMGKGDGTFQTATQYATDAYPTYVLIADLNGDGKFDLAVASSDCAFYLSCSPDFVSVLLGFGDGTFVGGTNYPFQSSTLAPQVLSADFNGDGKPDFVAETAFSPNGGPTPISVYLGNGDGTFQTEVTTSLAGSAGGIAAADFDGDGEADLATVFSNCAGASCPAGQAAVLIGNGDGTFQPPVEYQVGLRPQYLGVGDFNGDGKPDLAVSNFTSSTVSILINNGDGTFKPHVDYALSGGPQAMALADFIGNGKLDLAFAADPFLLGNGDGTFTTGSPLAVTPSDGIVAADFNGDGKLDLVVTQSDSNHVYILRGNGDGTFQAAVTDYVPAGPPSVANFNNDGKPDLIIGGIPVYSQCYPSMAELLMGNGDGSFQTPSLFFVSCGPVAVADFNQDGAPDVVAGSTTPGVVTVMSSAAFKAISPSSLNFGSQGVGTTSLPRTTIISNPSNVGLNIGSIAASGSFSQSNDCGTRLAPGVDCRVSVNFTPTTTGIESGSITITDATRISPLTIPLSGAGVNGPFLEAFPGRTNFAPQTVGKSSNPSAIMLVNTGNAALNMNGISITGVDGSDFTETNNCGSSLAVAGSCLVNVTFAPTAGGSRTASVSIADTAPGSPQSVGLTGDGLDFMLTPTGFPVAQTVSAGQSAKYSLVVAPLAGWSGTVNLNCSISPNAPSCGLSTSSVNIGGSVSQTVTVTLGTSAAKAGSLSQVSFPPVWQPLVWTGMLMNVGWLALRKRKRLPIFVVLALASWAGCGGGSSSPPNPPPPTPATPAGTYTATITATSGGSSHIANLVLTVD